MVRRKLFDLLYLLAVLLFLGCLLYIGIEYYQNQKSRQRLIAIQALAQNNEQIARELLNDEIEEIEDNSKETVLADIDLTNLIALNPDVIGWIRIPKTQINYPIVKTEDNSYYLNHNVFREYDRHGSVFMDSRNSINDDNLILYAHNMRSGSMFADLAKYKIPDYAVQNPYIYMLVNDEITVFEVYAAFYYSTSKHTAFNYLQRNWDKNFAKFVQHILQFSLLPKQTTMSIEEKLLTLSTCNYDAKGNRFVVMAKKIEDPFPAVVIQPPNA